MVDVLFLDKDQTLGEFVSTFGEPIGLYPNVPQFLEEQREKGRKRYITTTAGKEGKEHLTSVEHLLDGYFGSEQVDSSGFFAGLFYIRSDGTIRSIRDDYQHRRDFLPEEQRRLTPEDRHWRELLHKETKEPFDPKTAYANPHRLFGFLKDLYLVRRLIAPVEYADLRTVMVGDRGDRDSVKSDLETPLVIISDAVQEGNWDLVSRAVDHLFSSPELKPFQVYDATFETASQNGKKRAATIDGATFSLERNTRGGRFIYCP